MCIGRDCSSDPEARDWRVCMVIGGHRIPDMRERALTDECAAYFALCGRAETVHAGMILSAIAWPIEFPSPPMPPDTFHPTSSPQPPMPPLSPRSPAATARSLATPRLDRS
jgi:hypothetical protein